MRIRKTAILAAALLAAAPGGLEAAVSDSMLPSAGRIVLACVIVGMLIYATGFMLKRFVFRGNGRRADCIRIVGTYPLGQRTRLCMIETAGRIILLGITPQSISPLAEFDPSEIQVGREPSKVSGFIKHLHDFSLHAAGARGSCRG